MWGRYMKCTIKVIKMFDKETEQMIKLAEEQYKSGDVTVCNTWDEVQKHLDEL